VVIATGQHVPDILDCLAQLSNDEVPTPPVLAKSMLDLLPEEVWAEPDYRWLDPCCKSGVFLREIASRLLVGLSEWEPDFEARREHIYRNMLRGAAITEMTGIIARRTLYCSRDASGELSVVQFDQEQGRVPFVRAEHVFPARDGDDRPRTCSVCGAPENLERGATRENYAY
jgi:site-specific DNA-methyltransferase (adenine-specific)